MTNDDRQDPRAGRRGWCLAAGAVAFLGCGLPDQGQPAGEASVTVSEPTARRGLSISPVLATFPVTRVGEPCEVPELLTISNLGPGPATPAVSVLGDSFRIAHSECGELLAGQSCTIEVRFTPVTEGPRAGSVEAVAGSSHVRASLIGLGQGTPRRSARPQPIDVLGRGSERLPAAP
jgi:hypothetical protein